MDILKVLCDIWSLKEESKQIKKTAQGVNDKLLQKYAEGKEDGLESAYRIIQHRDYVVNKKAQTPCEWCESKVKISETCEYEFDDRETVRIGTTWIDVKNNYCPMCGRKVKEG